MRVDASKIRVGAGGWRGAGRIRAFKGLRFYFFFFPRQLKWKRDTVRTALSLTGLHPPIPSSALIIILTKALSKWAASHWSAGAVVEMTSEVSSLLLNLHWTDQSKCHKGDGGQRGFRWTKAVLTSQGCWPKIKTRGHMQEHGSRSTRRCEGSFCSLIIGYIQSFFPSPLNLTFYPQHSGSGPWYQNVGFLSLEQSFKSSADTKPSSDLQVLPYNCEGEGPFLFL